MIRYALVPLGLAAGAFSLLTADSSHPPGASPPKEEWKGPPGSVTPNLAAGSGGRLLVTWLEPLATQGRYAFRLAVREQGRWSKPTTIHESDRFFVNWADFGSLVETGGGRWVAHWLEKTAALPYAYHVMLSVSFDQGKSWSEPVRVHDDTSATEHGFVALHPHGTSVDLLWLDGRNLPGEERGAMTVRTRSLGPDNTFSPERELDARTCECCQTALTRTPEGLVAAWRDRSETEIRDIAVARQVRGQWQAPRVVAADEWEHRACPVNGPALVADGRRVDLVWYTGVRNEPRVWLVRSTDAAASFGQRIRIDDGQTLGRVDAEPLGDGSVLVAWLEQRSAEDAEWRIRRIGPNGEVGRSSAVATVSRARLAGFPRLAKTQEGVFLAYIGTSPARQVTVVQLFDQ